MPFNIPKNRIYLMPQLSKESPQGTEKRKEVAELCKKFGYNYSERLQVVIYNETTGV